jgi:hypothetical protein
VVAICTVRAAPMACSCSRARDAARSRSCEAAMVSWIVAMAATNVGSVRAVGAGAVRVKPDGGRRERDYAGRGEGGGDGSGERSEAVDVGGIILDERTSAWGCYGHTGREPAEQHSLRGSANGRPAEQACYSGSACGQTGSTIARVARGVARAALIGVVPAGARAVIVEAAASIGSMRLWGLATVGDGGRQDLVAVGSGGGTTTAGGSGGSAVGGWEGWRLESR